MRRPAHRRVAALAACLLLTAVSCGGGPGGESGGASVPGVLLITVDTLRADHLGCYGAAGDPTPRIDRLAAEGTLFADASTPIPVTLPAHASILTGVPPPVHGVRDNGLRLGDSLPTLAERLGDAGYRTAAFVGAVVLDAAGGLDRGFETYDDAIPVPLRADATGAASYPDRPAGEVVDAALGWLRGIREEERFFAWVHLFDPHAPYFPPEPFRTRHGATYESEVRYTDGEIGRLLDGLAGLGRDGDTLVILTADHGEGLGEHGETTHGFFLYQSTVHVPMILRLPGRLPAGARVDGPIGLLDLQPTILELAGPGGGEQDGWGHSLVPWARGGEVPSDRPLYLETYLPYFQMGWSGSHGLRRGDWKYLFATAPELYGLASDPGEDSNVAEDHRDVAGRLAELLASQAEAFAAAAAEPGAAPRMSEAERARLRSLGYLAGDAPETSADLEALARTRPDTRERIDLVDELLEAAPAAIDRGDPGAADRLARLAGRDPDNPRILAIAGKALLQHGRVDEAELLLRRAAELDPQDPRRQANLAAALIRAGRTGEALAAAERAGELGGGDPEVRRLRGNILLDAGRPQEAESEFRAALEINPDDLAAARGLGRALAAQKRHAEAADVLNDLLAREPEAAEELVLAGTSEYRLGRNDAAAGKFRRALAVDPGSTGALVGLALILGEGGDDRGAAELLGRAVRSAPDDPGILTLHAVAAARAGDAAAARRSLERSLALSPDQPAARALLQQLGG